MQRGKRAEFVDNNHKLCIDQNDYFITALKNIRGSHHESKEKY